MKKQFEVVFNQREKASLDRPAWTSETHTGMFHAYRHKHLTIGGASKIVKNHFVSKKGR